MGRPKGVIRTPRQIVRRVLHGCPINDPYQWLEGDELQETREWVRRQNQWTRSVLDSLPFQEQLRSRLYQLMEAESRTLPVIRGQTLFYRKGKVMKSEITKVGELKRRE
ncbi:MAG: hypothetical protein NZ959_02625 [Armatimonadetes bacterium]|nr:hypothetical protein [Armatimonadota bacterium]MDW8121526.1 hypothetical protein [Armatimonadota bacterium]